jgi:hypothetical protein
MAARRTSRPSPAALAAWRRRAIRRMSRSRAETLALVHRIPAAALRRPRTQAAWSVRDVLVHIAAGRAVWLWSPAAAATVSSGTTRRPSSTPSTRGSSVRGAAWVSGASPPPGGRTRPTSAGAPAPARDSARRSRSRAARDPLAPWVRLDARGRASPQGPGLGAHRRGGPAVTHKPETSDQPARSQGRPVSVDPFFNDRRTIAEFEGAFYTERRRSKAVSCPTPRPRCLAYGVHSQSGRTLAPLARQRRREIEW